MSGTPFDVCKSLKDIGIHFVTGVPDSLLSPIIYHFCSGFTDAQHVIAANEGAAVGLAIGNFVGLLLATFLETLLLAEFETLLLSTCCCFENPEMASGFGNTMDKIRIVGNTVMQNLTHCCWKPYCWTPSC